MIFHKKGLVPQKRIFTAKNFDFEIFVLMYVFRLSKMILTKSFTTKIFNLPFFPFSDKAYNKKRVFKDGFSRFLFVILFIIL